MTGIVSNKQVHTDPEMWMEAEILFTLGELIEMSIDEINDYIEENVCDDDEDWFMGNIDYALVGCEPDENVVIVKVTADLIEM